MINAGIPKGTRDFLPDEVVKRDYIFSVIRSVFVKYGYQPIETPAMENLATLTGKYGEEGDKLLFKILNSGDFLEKTGNNSLSNISSRELATHICEKGLRYDLTVPFARYVVQHRNDITFPFKRYQIQPVWRADRPQKGRFREFYQCDADVIGSNSVLNELELIQIIEDVFSGLGLKVTVLINNRKVLYGITEYLGFAERFNDFVVAIDKLDKIGLDGVLAELDAKGFSVSKNDLATYFPKAANMQEAEKLIAVYRNIFSNKTSVIGPKGLDELEELFGFMKLLKFQNANIVFDPTLARGLSYYTGIILEVRADGVAIGSVCGGGRYDDLTGIFGLPGVSGTGMSFGAERIYEAMTDLKLFPAGLSSQPRLMCANFGNSEIAYCLPLLHDLRKHGIAAELYPDTAKLSKQFSYANNKGIPFVLIAGEDEMNSGYFTLKNMQTGAQVKLTAPEIIKQLKA